MRALIAPARPSSGGLRRLSAALLTALVLLIAGCGGDEQPSAGSGGSIPVEGAGEAPRDDLGDMKRGTFGTVLTVPQLATFERANVKLINLTNATDADLDERVFQARAACGRLDASVPMLEAFAARCGPSIQLGKLTAVLGDRCGATGKIGQCGRILRRMATTMDAMAQTGRVYKLRVKEVTDDRACLKRLVPSAGAYRALRSGAKLARRAAVAIDTGDDAGFQSATTRFQEVAVKGIDEDGPPGPIINALRADCGLVKTVSPPGERVD